MFIKKKILNSYYLIFFFFLNKKMVGINKSKINIYIFKKMNYILNLKNLSYKLLIYKKYIYLFILKKNIYTFIVNFYSYFKKKLKYYLNNIFNKYSLLDNEKSLFTISLSYLNNYLNKKNIFNIKYYLNFIYFSYLNKFLYYFYINYMFNEKISYIPGRRKRYTVLRSPFKDKKSREQFELTYLKVSIKSNSIFHIINNTFFKSYLSNLLDTFKLEEINKQLIN